MNSVVEAEKGQDHGSTDSEEEEEQVEKTEDEVALDYFV